MNSVVPHATKLPYSHEVKPREWPMDPPPKPPRGVPRHSARLESASMCSGSFRSKLGTLDRKTLQTLMPPPPTESCYISPNKNASSQFSSTEKWMRIVAHFRQSIESRCSPHFDGTDAVNIVEEYLISNKEEFTGKNIGRDNAVKVLEAFMRQRIFESANGSNSFHDSRSSNYALLDQSYMLLVPSATPAKNEDIETPRHGSPVVQRANSFKRFLRNGFTRASSLTRPNSRTSSPAPSINRVEKEKPPPLTEEDVVLYRASLSRLLTYVEVNYLEGISNPNSHSGDDEHISLLSSILSKMRLFTRNNKIDMFLDEETEHFINTNHVASGPLLPFLNMSRMICPTIYLKREDANQTNECSVWSAQSLDQVAAHLKDVTRGGQAPLIPSEFSTIIEAVVSQVLLNDLRWHVEKRCIQYLVLLIPPVLRKQLMSVIQWINSANGTRSHCIMGPQAADPSSVHSDDNFLYVIETVQDFIVPSALGTKVQRVLIKGLVHLFKDGLIGAVPDELQADLEAARLNRDGASHLNVRFCETGEELDITTRELTNMMKSLLESTKFSRSEKRVKLNQFRAAYPHIYDVHFAHWK